jgi:uncharacterized protein YbcI
MPPRRDDLERRVRDAVVRFCKQHLGRGPRATRVFVVAEWVLVCAGGLLTAAERDLTGADPSGPAAALLKELFWRRVAHGRPRLEPLLAEGLGRAVHSVHADLCPQNGEAIIVLGLTAAPGEGQV